MDDKHCLVDYDFCTVTIHDERFDLDLTDVICVNDDPSGDDHNENINYGEAHCASGCDAISRIETVDEDVREAAAHCHGTLDVHSNTARNQLIVVSVFCFVFMLIEIVGGVLSNSLALLTDATHLARDLSSFFVGLFAIWLAKKPATARMSFGFHRAEVVGAFLSILIIWVLSGVLLYMAVDRFLHPDYEIDANQMLIVAGLGVAFNIVMGLVLSNTCMRCKFEHNHSHFGGGGHGHSHGGGGGHGHLDDAHSHNNTSNNNRSDSAEQKPAEANMNIRAALIHVIGDLIQSVGVLVAALIIKIEPDYKMADPICTVLFSVIVLFTTAFVLRDIFYVLMEASPRKLTVEYPKIRGDLSSITGVKHAHSLHVWALTMNKTAISVHLALESDALYHKVVKKASRMLREQYGGYHVTVQVEPYDDVMSECKQCIGPNVQ